MIFTSHSSTLPQHDTLRRLVSMRGIAILLQLLAVLIARFALGVELPMLQCLAVLVSLALFNGWAWRRMHQPEPLSIGELANHLLIDVIALSCLLYFSGGATNPFVSFYLPILAVAAAILPRRFALLLAVASIAAYSVLGFFYQPLRLQDTEQAVNYHLFGMWANFSLSVGLITWFVTRLSGTLRARDAQLALARERHLQSDRIVALGVQAASTAHEMGTPLSTVAVVIGELRAEANRLPALAAYRDDLAVIDAQIALCKVALDRMNAQARPDTAGDAGPAVVSEWLIDLMEGWRLRYPATRLQQTIPDGGARIADCAIVSQILLTLLDNAAQATRDQSDAVALRLTVDGHAARIRIEDSGSGIAPALRRRLGYEPVRSTSGGQGIGLMLAFASARQIGAKIELESHRPNGTVATLTLLLA